MITYIYFIFLILVLSYSIYRDFLLYKKGKYIPRIIRTEDDIAYVKSVIINLIVILGARFFVPDDKLYILIIIFFIATLAIIVSTSILSYLSYKKTKDKKIIKNAIILNLIVIGIGIFIAMMEFKLGN